MRLIYILIIVIFSLNIVYSQNKLSEKYLRNCLPFKIHVFERLEKIEYDLIQKPHKVYTTVYSDPSNHARIVFRGDKIHHRNYYVMVATNYELSDSIFMKFVGSIIECVINNKDGAIKWFEQTIQNNLNSSIKCINEYKVFGKVRIKIQNYPKDSGTCVTFIQEPFGTMELRKHIE